MIKTRGWEERNGGLLSHEDPKSDKLAELSVAHAGELAADEWESAGPLPRWPYRQAGALIPASSGEGAGL